MSFNIQDAPIPQVWFSIRKIAGKWWVSFSYQLICHFISAWNRCNQPFLCLHSCCLMLYSRGLELFEILCANGTMREGPDDKHYLMLKHLSQWPYPICFPFTVYSTVNIVLCGLSGGISTPPSLSDLGSESPLFSCTIHTSMEYHLLYIIYICQRRPSQHSTLHSAPETSLECWL